MKIKKMLSFVLVAAMMLSVLVMPAAAVEENEVVVHYYNENNWENPYIYYYSDGNTPINWPGAAMKNDGDNWYSYTISNFTSAKVIFSNNGADQYPGQNQEGLTVSGEKWYKSGSFYNQRPDLSKIIVHYYNTNGWGNPYIYYYTDNANPVTWPGAAMTSDGNGWYSYDIYGYDSAKVIFSDNGNNQDPAQNESGYDVSGEKWYINGQLYDSEPDGITVHFYNYDNWNNVNIYYYSDEITGSDWTGVPMSSDGDGWYTYKIYGLDKAKVLFNNGAGIQIPGVMEEGFSVSDEMWYRNGTWTTERPEEITVYFYKPENWSAPNIYYYLNENDTGSAWPGEAMVKVGDDESVADWYVFTITKYSSAKVMFNDGNNQIPGQNQPGLDASGIMWYKNGIWCDSETDSDGDELPDCGELVLGTDINKADTDRDLLTDGYEVSVLGTNPLKVDSDGNGISDANEDADEDNISNLEEYRFETDPINKDSDDDGLEDGDEVNVYGTEPTNPDTDGDTLSDGDEIALGLNPLVKDTDGDGIPDCDEKIQQTMTQEISEEEKPEVTDVTVSFEGTGNINTTTTIENIYNVDMLSSGVVGLVGVPVEIETTSEFDTATITFTYDPDELGDTKEEDLSVMWYDEENNIYLLQASTVDKKNHTVSSVVTHFSKYMIVDRLEWFEAWSKSIDYMEEKSYFDTVIAIDCSGSMDLNDPYFEYKAPLSDYSYNTCYRALAAKSYIESKEDEDKISVITFEDWATVRCALTTSKEIAINALSNIHSYGGTNFESVIKKACDILNQANDNHNKTILFISDGEATISDATLENAVENGIRINTVFVGETEENEIMKKIADETGGAYFKAAKAEDLMEIADWIALNEGIDITDFDEDGLYDVYERKGMRISNGQIIYTNPKLADGDFDGLLDGEEIIQSVDVYYSSFGDPFNIDGKYPEMKTQIVFTKKSDPHIEDSDGDGFLDGEVYKDIEGRSLPKDPKPLKYEIIPYLDDLCDLAMIYTNDFEKSQKLVLDYIRAGKYVDVSGNVYGDIYDSVWGYTLGEIDSEFIKYVNKENPNIQSYIYCNGEIDAKYIKDPVTKELIDFTHFAATFGAYLFYTDPVITLLGSIAKGYPNMTDSQINNLAGWAGDLQTFIQNDLLIYYDRDYGTWEGDHYFDESVLNQYSEDDFRRLTIKLLTDSRQNDYDDSTHILLNNKRLKNTLFRLEDQIADIDAVNICKYYSLQLSLKQPVTISECINNYYLCINESNSCTKRYDSFFESLFYLDSDHSYENKYYALCIDYLNGNITLSELKEAEFNLYYDYVITYTNRNAPDGKKWKLYLNAPVTENVSKGVAKGFVEYIIYRRG